MRLAGLHRCSRLSSLSAVPLAGDWTRDGRPRRLFEGLVRGDEPGLAVARPAGREDGVRARIRGPRPALARRAIDAGTAFRLASVTKQFTATAVMLLVRDGKLRYDDALTDVVPAFPAYGRAITIRHLLTHTSGLPDYEDLMAAAEKGRAPIWTAERQIHDDEVLALLRDARRAASPRDELGLQQLGLRRAGPDRRAGLRQAVRGVPARAGLRAARAWTGRSRTRRGRTRCEPRLRPHARGSRLPRDRPERDLGDARRRRRLLDPRGPREVGRGAAGGHAPLAGGDEAGAHAREARGRLGSPLARRARAATTSRPGGRWPTASAGSSTPGAVTRGCGTTARRAASARSIERFPDDRLTVVILANRNDLDLRALALRGRGRRLAGR